MTDSPAKLLVQDEHGAVQVIPLGAQPCVIGRSAGCDVRLLSPFVSSRHAQIEPQGAGHCIIDLGSRNGLICDGRVLHATTPIPLHDGDILRIGDPSTGGFISLTYTNPQVPRDRLPAPRRYPLDPQRARISIGRDGTDIILNSPQVSRQHAAFERTPEGRLLHDLDSTNGSFINGQRVTSQLLHVGDLLQIGPFRLIFQGDWLESSDDQHMLRLDAESLWRNVTRNGQSEAIIKDISLSLAPRELVVIMGGSGAGKSTLLKALSGFTPADSGHVWLNGIDSYAQPDSYRSLIGYVPQEDTLHRSLTVERALFYAAELRLPEDSRPNEIAQRIASALATVEMQQVRQTPIAQLSGGQRKRVSLAAELLGDPILCFLDEPTAGLDPALEKRLFFTLRRLADSGKTIALATHATSSILHCDRVAVLAEGRLVFFGAPQAALRFFAINNGDFADIYTKLEGRADSRNPEHWAIVQRDLANEYVALATQSTTVTPSLAELWEQKFRSITPQKTTVAPTAIAAQPQPLRLASHRHQFSLLLRRNLELLERDRRNLAILLLQAPLIAALLTLVFSPDALVGDAATASEAKKVLLLLAIVAIWFGTINAARELAKEADIFRRERLAGLRILPYLGSKFVLLLLLIALQSAVLLGITGLRVQFPAAGPLLPAWAELYLTTLLSGSAGLGIGLALSAVARTPDRAISLVPLALIPQILFAGVVFGLGDGITPQRILSWLTISRWAMDAYGTTANLNQLPLSTGLLQPRIPASEFSFSAAHLLASWGLLLLFSIACLALTAWLLRRRAE